MPYRCKGDVSVYSTCVFYARATRAVGDHGKVRTASVESDSSSQTLLAPQRRGASARRESAPDPPVSSACRYYENGYCRLHDTFVATSQRRMCLSGGPCPLSKKGEQA